MFFGVTVYVQLNSYLACLRISEMYNVPAFCKNDCDPQIACLGLILVYCICQW